MPKLIAPALASALAVLALGTAMPAQAAGYHHQSQTGHYADDHRSTDRSADRYTASRSALIRSDINNLRRDIDRAAARRVISQREATGLRRDAVEVQRLYANYARGGLSGPELQTLQRKVDRIHVALRKEARDQDGKRR